MAGQTRGIEEISSYHAHTYFRSSAERGNAERLRAEVARRFRVRLGRWHDVPVGPHSTPMFQIAFEPSLFAALVPWLMINRRGLSILVHPNTTGPRRDHLDDALWLGERQALIADKLPVSQDVPDEAGEPNTDPTLAI